MGLKDYYSKIMTDTQQVNPDVAECDRRLGELQNEKTGLFTEIGRKFASEHEADMAAGTIYEKDMDNIVKVEKEIENTEKKKLAVQGLRKCASCGNIISLDSVFCNKCGAKQEEIVVEQPVSKNICPKCGAKHDEGNNFCTMCGHKFAE